MMDRGIGYGRALVWGGMLGALAVAAVLGAAFLGIGSSGYRSAGVPDEVLVVCVTRDAEGASLGGVLFLLEEGGEARVVDPTQEVTLPGTSYQTLQDAYPFGGGNAVSRAYARAEGVDSPAWLVLPEDTWTAIVDQGGGVPVQVERGANVFLDERLISIEEGAQTLGGSELAAWWASAPFAPSEPAAARVRNAVSEALVHAVWQEKEAVVEAFADGKADTPLAEADLRSFLGD